MSSNPFSFCFIVKQPLRYPSLLIECPLVELFISRYNFKADLLSTEEASDFIR